jgi:hypothetical protein
LPLPFLSFEQTSVISFGVLTLSASKWTQPFATRGEIHGSTVGSFFWITKKRECQRPGFPLF